VYRVMIVDDEEPVLESFSYILKKGIPDFELCGMARSGPEAIALVPEANPDLVFMDIQMQGMDGIEAISKIQKRHPNIIFILSTAYERFDIAQKAIPLGVFNYLVKPVSRKALEDEFAKVKAQLDEMREKTASQIAEAHYAQKMRDEEKRTFLLGLAWASPGEQEWREFSRLFSIKGDFGAVMLFKIVNPLPENEIERAYRELVHRLQYKFNCLSAVIAGQMVILFPESKERERTEKRIENAVDGVGSFDYRFGAGKLRHFSSLNESYREAFEQLKSIEGKRASPMGQRRAIRALCEKFLFAEWEEVRLLYEKYWMEVFMSNDFHVAKAKMIAFFVHLTDRLDADARFQCGIDVDFAEEIVSLSSVQNWRQWSSYMMDRLKSVIKENKDQYFPKPLTQAVNFIKENYSTALQLSSVAEKCEISQGYLSRLFSEFLNTTFIDYLNTLRIGEAVKLLRGGKKSVKEVSYLVGYADPNYFSRIFKRYMNVSPSDLAKGGGNNEA
jgi:two-component system, response regulator YesN